MKKLLLPTLFCLALGACKKETLTNQPTYADLVYRITTTDSFLLVNYMEAVYNETVKGNIGRDTILQNPGTYNIEATVLTGINVSLYGMSERGPNFELRIISDGGTTLAQTDSITFYPANSLHPDQYVSRISIVP